MTCDQANELIAASWHDELDAARELSLNRHLASCPECTAEMVALTGMWQRLGSLPAPEPSNALRVRWESTLESLIGTSSPQRRAWSFGGFWPRRPLWQGAIALASLALGIFVGSIAGPMSSRHDRELARLHEEIASTREMVALSLLQQQSATQRLKGIDYSGRMPVMEPEIVSALIQAVDHDPSVNVRLAAIDALGKAAGSARVLNSLTQSLPSQDSPMVQAALVDYFVDAHDRQAVGALQRLAQQRDLNPAVLERTQTALRELTR